MKLEPMIEADFTLDEPFELVSGKVLPKLKQHYAIYGEINADKSNVVLVCHALSGSARIHEWWGNLIGAGKTFDTDKNAFLCVNYIGSCNGSTGACSVNPKTGRNYGAEFPLVTIQDIAKAQKKLLDFLEIEKLKAAVGGSCGGMLGLQMAADFPDSLEKCIAIGACELSAMALALNHLQREALKAEKGVSLARQIAMISYKSKELFDKRFARKANRNGESPFEEFESRFDVAGYLDYQGKIFTERFDAETFKIISKAMDLFYLADEEIRRIKAKTYLVGISSDWLFPMEDVRQLCKRLHANRVDVDFIEMISPDGHDAFLSDTVKMSGILEKIL